MIVNYSIGIAAALGLGFIAGGFVGGLVVWRWLRSSIGSDGVVLDPGVDQAIDAAAQQWAAAHGMPAATPLVADKLRLVTRLRAQPRQHRRMGRRWGR